jgi:hypothetical protein
MMPPWGDAAIQSQALPRILPHQDNSARLDGALERAVLVGQVYLPALSRDQSPHNRDGGGVIADVSH